MSTPFEIPVTTAGMLAAIACVVAGGPLFAGGLRALRLRRLLAGLSPAPARPRTHGYVHLQGTVALESPLFAPLSMRPCAGYRLDVRAADAGLGGHIGQRRGFRLVSDGCEAFVEATGNDWELPVTAEREVAAGEQVSANMAALLEGDVTLRWLRDRRAPMRIVERSLEAGSRVEVIGHARAVEDHAMHEAILMQATGTDGERFSIAAPAPAERPQLRVAGAEPLELRVVGGGDADASRYAPPLWRASGVLLGPLLTLAGLVYLVHAAEATLAGRF
jgi:hypothetical protein